MEGFPSGWLQWNTLLASLVTSHYIGCNWRALRNINISMGGFLKKSKAKKFNMLQFAFNIDRYRRLADEVNFALINNFDFVQIWYDNNGISIHEYDYPLEENEINIPFIFHAVLKPNDFDEHIPLLCSMIKKYMHEKLIIHPVLDTEDSLLNSVEILDKNVKMALEALTPLNCTLFLENNSRIEPIFQTKSDIEHIFTRNPNVELLFDIAHIDNYEYMKDVIKIKYPKLIHCADRNLHVPHEHLSLGQGNIDFEYIFNEIIPDYNGGIIFEIFDSYEDRLQAKILVDNILNKSSRP